MYMCFIFYQNFKSCTDGLVVCRLPVSINNWVQIQLNSCFVADSQYFFSFIYSDYFLFFLYLYVQNPFTSIRKYWHVEPGSKRLS